MIDKKEINKIARMIKYPKPNLPVPAVLVACCLIDALAKDYDGKTRCNRFAKYIECNMQKTFSQLQNNDSKKPQQIKVLDCSFKGHEKSCCRKSIEILYRHIRCGLTHNYFKSEGCRIINRPNVKKANVIVDFSKKFHEHALVLNGPAFVKDFLASCKNMR